MTRGLMLGASLAVVIGIIVDKVGLGIAFGPGLGMIAGMILDGTKAKRRMSQA